MIKHSLSILPLISSGLYLLWKALITKDLYLSFEIYFGFFIKYPILNKLFPSINNVLTTFYALNCYTSCFSSSNLKSPSTPMTSFQYSDCSPLYFSIDFFSSLLSLPAKKPCGVTIIFPSAYPNPLM